MERYFSECGDIQTAKRNKLGVQKVAKLATVGIGIKRQHAESGESVKRLKRSNCVPVHENSGKDRSGRNLGLAHASSEIEPDAAADSCDVHDTAPPIEGADDVLDSGRKDWAKFQTQLLHELEHADSEPVRRSLTLTYDFFI